MTSAADGAGGDRRYVYGVHPVAELLRSRPEAVEAVLLARRSTARGDLAELLDRARARGVPVERLAREDLSRRVGADRHQGVAARLAGQASAEPRDPAALVVAAREAGRVPLLVALDRIQDPRNLGAILRSAHAFGAEGLLVPRDRSAPLTSAAVKASAGASALCPVVRVTNLARTLRGLKEQGLWVVGADASEAAVPAAEADLSVPLVIVVGAEGPGLRRLVRDSCDRLVRIPMLGEIASLNASVAAGIFLYEITRQRPAVTRDEVGGKAGRGEAG